MRRDRAPVKSKVNADRKLVETVEELISIYKREFGGDWKVVLRETLNVVLGRS